jgi:hypothetical protein
MSDELETPTNGAGAPPEPDARQGAAEKPSSSFAEGPRRAGEQEDEDEFPSVDGVIGTFMSEASLWPVLVVALGSGGAFGAAMLILAGVDHNPFAAAALLLVTGMSVDVGLRARREPEFRNIAKLIALLWGAAFAFAAIAIWTGIAFG